ncbi:hypothetical protein [Streptomyces sp. NPDC049906]|uniref:hypothetical protein n=1 Tax=Streptomyces sp. NPDC049906 TaxID=3155656 RepID=UPI003437BE54
MRTGQRPARSRPTGRRAQRRFSGDGAFWGGILFLTLWGTVMLIAVWVIVEGVHLRDG